MLASHIEDGGKRGQHLKRILLNMFQLNENINAQYVIKEISDFTRAKQFENVVLRAAEKLGHPSEQTNAEIESMFNEVLRANKTSFDPGISLDDLPHLLKHLEAREHNEFVTGIPELDKRHVVRTRSTLMVFLGSTGTGKSWWLIRVGGRAIRHHKVAHVMLELSEAEVQKRYWQSFLALPAWQRHLTTSVTRLQLRDGRLIGFGREQITAPYSMQQPDHQRLADFLSRTRSLKNLRIKKFPMRGLTVAGLSGSSMSKSMNATKGTQHLESYRSSRHLETVASSRR